MKYLCRGQMDRARFYLDKLIELHKKSEVLGPFFINWISVGVRHIKSSVTPC